jgi:putative acetyltransferase
MSTVTIAREALASPIVQTLIAALNAELEAMYPEEGANHFSLAEAEVAPGRGAFLVARDGDEPVGCGAVRLIDPATAELKRMFVMRARRGQGISRRILAALEDEARALGATRVVLETGERQLEAIGLYTRAGYERCPAWGEYIDSPLSLCMGKALL